MTKSKLTPNQLAGLRAVVNAGDAGLAPTVRGPTSGRTLNSLQDAGLVRIEGTSDTSGQSGGIRRVFIVQAGRDAAER